jgi:hypothetical protein
VQDQRLGVDEPEPRVVGEGEGGHPGGDAALVQQLGQAHLRRNIVVMINRGVSGELVEGKATWLERHGREFELPEGHTAAWGDLHGKRCVSLEATGGGGGQYYVEGVEEDDERVLIHVGEHVWETGYGEGSPSAELPAGYPFPT